MRALIPALIAVLWAIAAVAAEIPAGTELQVRLKTKVATASSKAGDRVEAVLIASAVAKAGAIVTGTVVAVENKAGERAILDLEFTQLEAGNVRTTIAARVSAVDNARETVEETGRITGILSSETITAQIDKGLEKLSERAAKFSEILRAAKGAVLKPVDASITYEPGVELILKLTKAVAWGGPSGSAHLAEPDTAMRATVLAQPFLTRTEKDLKPSDITSLMFAGSREQVEAAFAAAGWTTAAARTSESVLETIRAVAEQRGYKEAPMSILTLDGQKPDMVFQKQNNTFAKRHHLRIWKRAGEQDGREIWVSSATHDIGIEYSPENKTFIHKIDPKIDNERQKTVSDLQFSGKVKRTYLVDRPAVPRRSQNATGDDLITDGKMAVLVLN
ncbi:MAG: hypothetical protein EXQ52_14465 [Bryobacterales bacterium]|nr:hypothetical protein [Bryobacterales bacterium]